MVDNVRVEVILTLLRVKGLFYRLVLAGSVWYNSLRCNTHKMQRRGSCSDPNPIACRDCRTPTHRVVPISAGKKETKASEVNLDEQRRLVSPSSISQLNSEQMTHLITNICRLRWLEFPSHLSTDTLEIIFVEGRFMINFALTGMTWKWMDSCNLLLRWQLLRN